MKYILLLLITIIYTTSFNLTPVLVVPNNITMEKVQDLLIVKHIKNVSEKINLLTSLKSSQDFGNEWNKFLQINTISNFEDLLLYFFKNNYILNIFEKAIYVFLSHFLRQNSTLVLDIKFSIDKIPNHSLFLLLENFNTNYLGLYKMYLQHLFYIKNFKISYDFIIHQKIKHTDRFNNVEKNFNIKIFHLSLFTKIFDAMKTIHLSFSIFSDVKMFANELIKVFEEVSKNNCKFVAVIINIRVDIFMYEFFEDWIIKHQTLNHDIFMIFVNRITNHLKDYYQEMAYLHDTFTKFVLQKNVTFSFEIDENSFDSHISEFILTEIFYESEFLELVKSILIHLQSKLDKFFSFFIAEFNKKNRSGLINRNKKIKMLYDENFIDFDKTISQLHILRSQDFFKDQTLFNLTLLEDSLENISLSNNIKSEDKLSMLDAVKELTFKEMGLTLSMAKEKMKRIFNE